MTRKRGRLLCSRNTATGIVRCQRVIKVDVNLARDTECVGGSSKVTMVTALS
jgi:hypothetical protein